MTHFDQKPLNRAALFDRLSRYLNGPADRPIGICVSGGGDSIALLHLLAQWGQRPIRVLHVDHGLQAQSHDWAMGVKAHAKRLGADFYHLRWKVKNRTKGYRPLRDWRGIKSWLNVPNP